MRIETVAVLAPGDMGSGVGKDLRGRGFRVVTCLAGRSERSQGLAAAAGLEALDSLDDVIAAADLVLSILPPAAAEEQAAAVAAAIARTGRAGRAPAYLDANAIAPQTSRRIGTTIAEAGAPYTDGGIIGLPPGRAGPTRLYVSGPDLEPALALAGPDLLVRPLGPEIGQASAIKMCYAGLTKGTNTLFTAVLVAAARLGVDRALSAEFSESQPQVLERMRRSVPRLPADSARWIGEMEQIAATFASVGLTSGFHDGAADIFRLLAATPIAAETRETLDPSRTLEQAVAIYAAQLARAAE